MGTSREGKRLRVLLSFICRILSPDAAIKIPPTRESSFNKSPCKKPERLNAAR
jgi:hypothetical protein